MKACLFDMDGLLINTEDMYTIAVNNILALYGKGTLKWDLKIQLQGLPGPDASRKVIDYYNLPLTFEEFDKLNRKFEAELWPTSEFMPGTAELIAYLKSKNIPIAVCTSSTSDKFHSKTSHLAEAFKKFDVIITGDDSRIPPGRGKPFPDIWNLGLKELNAKFNSHITPEECLVFEDGIPGVRAGKAFGAYVIWIPHVEAVPFISDPSGILEGKGEILSSMTEFEPSKFGL